MPEENPIMVDCYVDEDNKPVDIWEIYDLTRDDLQQLHDLLDDKSDLDLYSSRLTELSKDLKKILLDG